MKQFRAVYTYKRDLLRGAGACFAIAPDEKSARASIESAMPGVQITELREEPQDPLAAYERHPLKLVHVEKRRCGSCHAELATDEGEVCGDCERQMWADDAARDRARRSAEEDRARREDLEVLP